MKGQRIWQFFLWFNGWAKLRPLSRIRSRPESCPDICSKQFSNFFRWISQNHKSIRQDICTTVPLPPSIYYMLHKRFAWSVDWGCRKVNSVLLSQFQAHLRISFQFPIVYHLSRPQIPCQPQLSGYITKQQIAVPKIMAILRSQLPRLWKCSYLHLASLASKLIITFFIKRMWLDIKVPSHVLVWIKHLAQNFYL